MCKNVLTSIIRGCRVLIELRVHGGNGRHARLKILFRLRSIERNGNIVTFYFIKGNDVYQFSAMESDNIKRIIN